MNINQAAKEYARAEGAFAFNFEKMEHFIAGATSPAAKEYWEKELGKEIAEHKIHIENLQSEIQFLNDRLDGRKSISNF